VDLAGDPEYASELARLADAHFNWTRQHHSRITVTGEQINARAKGKEPPGIYIGIWDKDEMEKVGKILPDKASG
ncbi:MAG: phosphonate monoester hydrolase, partial [Paracoccaceae bacterium]